MNSDHPLEALLTTFRETEPRGKQGRFFESLMRWWLLNDPEFKARFKSAFKPRKDIGIDLVAVPRHGGKPTAVQCKQWAGAIPKSEIDSFLSAAATDEYADSLLIHTGTGFSANAATTIASQHTQCVVVDLDRLRKSDVRWPASIHSLETGTTLPPRLPWEHQAAALAQIRFELRPGRTRTWVDMACGTGKTLVGTLAADEFAPNLAVVFVPTTTALHETVRAWRRDSRAAFAELRVCSQHEPNDRDLEDLSQPHENVTTSPGAISKFLAGAGRRVLFCTNASAARLIEAVAMTTVTIELIVVDDAHNIACARGTTGPRAILDDRRLPAARRLFLTATPRVWDTDALKLAAQRGAPLVDMSNSCTGDFGVRAYRLTHRDAVIRKIVLPFEVHVVQITTHEVEQIVRSRRLVAAEGHSTAVLASLAATQVAVVKAADDLQLRRIVAFHIGVKESALFAHSFAATAALVTNNKAALIAPVARHVDSYDAVRRKQTISWFERSAVPCILSNNKLLAEGIDRPDIDAIIYNDPHAPAARVIQAVGRALRPAPGKTKAIIIIPMIVGPDGNVEKARVHSTFAATIRILDALRTIDPEFKLNRDSLRLYAAKRMHDPASRSTHLQQTTVAPLEVTDAFAAAIEHRVLPPRNANAGARDPRREARHRSVARAPVLRVVSAPTRPRRMRHSAFINGLNRLENASGDDLLFKLSHPDDAQWLAAVHDRLAKGTLAGTDLQRIASHLSFLASGLGPSNSELRDALAIHADRSVPVQLAAWLRAERPSSSYVYRLATLVRNHRWPAEDLAAQTHAALTHPGIYAVERARLCLRPLLAAASGLGTREDPNSRLAGLIVALERPWDTAPPQSSHGWRSDARTDVARADWATYEAGWDAGHPWRAHARLIARLNPAAHEDEIRWALTVDKTRPRAKRWDYLTWAVFIDELDGIAGDKHRAARLASTMGYRARARRVLDLVCADAIANAA